MSKTTDAPDFDESVETDPEDLAFEPAPAKPKKNRVPNLMAMLLALGGPSAIEALENIGRGPAKKAPQNPDVVSSLQEAAAKKRQRRAEKALKNAERSKKNA